MGESDARLKNLAPNKHFADTAQEQQNQSCKCELHALRASGHSRHHPVHAVLAICIEQTKWLAEQDLRPTQNFLLHYEADRQPCVFHRLAL